MNEIDTTMPEGKWEFNESVADCFENMLERSIPQYNVMRKCVEDLVECAVKDSHAKKPEFEVLDIGCSDGLVIESLLRRLQSGRYTGVDISDAMLKKAKLRLLDDILAGSVNIQKCDLRTDFPKGHYDIVTSILSLQFIPIEYRQHIIREIYDNLSDRNGCFIMVEKVLGNTDTLNQWFIKNYYAMKSDNEYTQEQIERKRLSLEGVLVPVTNDWNIDLLKQAGFKEVDVFWRWMNFVGYIAIK